MPYDPNQIQNTENRKQFIALVKVLITKGIVTKAEIIAEL